MSDDKKLMDALTEWCAETPDYHFRFNDHTLEGDEKYLIFVGTTKKRFGNRGRYFQELHVTRELFERSSEEQLITILTEMMDDAVKDAIECYVAMGELKP